MDDVRMRPLPVNVVRHGDDCSGALMCCELCMGFDSKSVGVGESGDVQSVEGHHVC